LEKARRRNLPNLKPKTEEVAQKLSTHEIIKPGPWAMLLLHYVLVRSLSFTPLLEYIAYLQNRDLSTGFIPKLFLLKIPHLSSFSLIKKVVEKATRQNLPNRKIKTEEVAHYSVRDHVCTPGVGV
jgi:hypothetical protein